MSKVALVVYLDPPLVLKLIILLNEYVLVVSEMDLLDGVAFQLCSQPCSFGSRVAFKLADDLCLLSGVLLLLLL